ncbi:MAG: LuxR C-terminal-related transcriptional regulator [Pseudomonadota bacterium]
MLDFSQDVLDAQGPVAVWEKTTRFMEQFGFLGCVYGRRILNQTPTTRDIRFSNKLLGWQEAYMTHRDYERDPLFIYAPEMPPTFFTGSAFLEDYPYLQPEDVAVIKRAEVFGITSGIALRMSSGEDGVVRGWNLLSEFTKEKMIEIHANYGQLLLVGAALADQRIVLEAPGSLEELSKRETDCLCLLAEGLRTEQIGLRLGIRPVTVDLHMRNARTKLGAQTREQALAIAITHKKIVV